MYKGSAKRLLLTLAIFIVTVGALRAQSGVFDRTGSVAGHGTYSSVPMEIVDLFTGNLMLAYRDIFLPGPEGLNLEVWRVYNSKVLGDGSPGQGSVQAYPKSMLGLGWSMHMGILHQATSSLPIIEFPDGRRETAYPDNYGVGKHITKGFLKLNKGIPPLIDPRLYFQNGVVWTFSRSASVPLAGGGDETVYFVTKIEDAKGNSIQVDYDPADNYRSISSITDACGRVITFHKAYNGSNPARLTSITLSNFDGTHDVTYSYSVSAFANGYYRLDSFTPPCPNPATFEYNDGASERFLRTA
ncbi:MAG: hypothetical protein ABFD52_10940 [Acidobacteriota bacterium]